MLVFNVIGWSVKIVGESYVSLILFFCCLILPVMVKETPTS